jgi:hypothetical protein
MLSLKLPNKSLTTRRRAVELFARLSAALDKVSRRIIDAPSTIVVVSIVFNFDISKGTLLT